MDMRPVRIYSTENVPRLRYIAGIILEDILGLSWEVITDKRKQGKHPVVNYSNEDISGSFKISPDKLLFETGVSGKEITVNDWKGLPVFFHTSSDSDLPFDIFAASFFLVSRYEEYLEYKPNEHGQFSASSSLAFKNGFLGIPVVDIWAREFAKAFLKRFQTLAFKRNVFKSLVAIDADQPFAYLGKSLFQSIGGLLSDIKNHDGHAGERYRILAKGEKDPYEIFDYIVDNIGKNNTDARFFFPVGDNSIFDKNPSWKNTDYRRLIKRIAGKYSIGSCLSYYSAGNPSLINHENVRLKSITEKDIILSRFHYVRILMPHSYIYLQEAGISEDYSMGYPEEAGFRAGIARPYYFYNIFEDKQTSLKIIPFQIMDWMLFKYKHLDTDASGQVVSRMINETRKVGGTYVSIWHNTFLLDNRECQGRREVFEFMLRNQTP